MPNVNVTYEEMRQAANRLESGKAEITQKLSELQKLVSSLVNGGYVTDSSSRNFEHAYQEFNGGAERAIEGLTQMGTYLNRAANTFQEADQSLSQALGKG